MNFDKNWGFIELGGTDVASNMAVNVAVKIHIKLMLAKLFGKRNFLAKFFGKDLRFPLINFIEVKRP